VKDAEAVGEEVAEDEEGEEEEEEEGDVFKETKVLPIKL